MNKRFIITPKIKAGNVCLKDSRDEIRRTLGSFKEFKKNRFSRNTTDDFEICHVYYDDNNCCEAIEFFNDIELIFNGVNLFEEKMDNIIELLLKTDKKIEKEKNMITSKALGLSIYFLDREPKSILVFSDNYYS